MTPKAKRIKDANELIQVISSYGRRFFYSEKKDRVARFEQTLDGRLWFRDDYTGKRILVAYRYRWRHFSHGGTLRSLVEALALFIRTGQQIAPSWLGPWPTYICEGDLWGYGIEEMTRLRQAVRGSNCVAWKEVP